MEPRNRRRQVRRAYIAIIFIIIRELVRIILWPFRTIWFLWVVGPILSIRLRRDPTWLHGETWTFFIMSVGIAVLVGLTNPMIGNEYILPLVAFSFGTLLEYIKPAVAWERAGGAGFLADIQSLLVGCILGSLYHPVILPLIVFFFRLVVK